MPKIQIDSVKKIVVIGGGTGVFTVITGLKKYFSNLTAIVTMADNGGSTGVLREEFGILPPGDIRRALVALAPSDQFLLSELFNYRFQEGGGLTGHSFGNLLITALERITGSFEKAVEEAGKILAIQGRVLPVTLHRTHLLAETDDGRSLKGETNIDRYKPETVSVIKKIWLEPEAVINPKAEKTILEADCIILSPGDFYTSLIPNILVKGAKEALRASKATILYFTNIMNKYSETAGFQASNFLEALQKYLGKNVLDYVLINKTKPTLMRVKPYIEQKSEFVVPDLENFKSKKPVPVAMDLLKSKGLIRHDPDKIAKAVKMFI